MFSVKCDLCGNIQTEENPSALTGTTIVMNGATRHSCGTCADILKAAFVIGKEGLQDPMKALVKLTQENEKLTRTVQAIGQVKSGDVLSMQDVFGSREPINLANPQVRPGQRLGMADASGARPRGALGHRKTAPALPAPKKKERR